MKKIHKATYTTARSAFTLAELLVGILVVSVILTLLAPVITKRAKESISINGGGAGAGTVKSKLFIYNESDPDCTQAAGSTNVLDCTFTAPQGVNRINAIAVSGGGGGAGATQPTIETGKRLTVANTTVGSSRTQEITITNNMKNILISQLIGSGAGGGGASWRSSGGSGGAPTSQADCDPFNALFIPAAYNGSGGKNLCVTKYNVGDTYGPEIPNNVKIVSTGTYCYTNCCWQGITSNNCTDTGNSDSIYSGCNRTVCTRSAAKTACSKWAPSGTRAGSWRLPTKNEINGWNSKLSTLSINRGRQGLQLCDGTSSSGSVRCSSTANCKGAKSSTCFSRYIWTSSTDVVETTHQIPTGTYQDCTEMYYGNNGISYCKAWGSKCISNPKNKKWAFACYNEEVREETTYIYYDLYSGRLRAYDNEETDYAASARCVLQSGLSSNTVSSGGGGGAGAYVKNYQIPNSVISSNIGGKIVLYSAAGGAGGSSASSSGSSASNGSNGNTSYIEVYSSDNVLKWGIRASGGYAGEGASSSSYGEGGAERTIASCQLYENGSWRSVNCTGIGAKGLDGTKVENASSTNTATGGTGAGSMYNTTVAQGGGVGGSTSGANGYSGSVYGAGGGGATIVFDSSNNVTKGIGGNGANGVAEITYDLVYSAAAGGGGGGGAYVELSDISVSSGNTYTIKVGNGGSGGSISTKGSDGGESEIVFDSITYTLSGGKGGQIGTSATSTTNVIQGIGGSGGIVSSNVSDTTNIKYKNGSKGEDGGSFTKDDTHSNSTNYGGSYGGVGGVSGIDTKGSCSGLFIDSSICSNTTVNGITNTFVAPIINNTAIDYGQAGAGGGGGGWSENTILYPNPGSGSQGQGGYVFIYWRE